MSYQKSAQTRQAILDYLHANPAKRPQQIADGIGADGQKVNTCIKFMLERGEVERVNEKGAYSAIAKTTISAKEVIAGMQAKMKPKTAKEKAPPVCLEEDQVTTIIRPGHIAHRGMNRNRPLQAQGGQGALRREFGIQPVMA